MSVFLIFGLFVLATGHNITYFEVPQYADPRAAARLVCQYALDDQDPPIHSVKWYRGKHEILRYTPGQPTLLTFNTSMSAGVTGNCNYYTCAINVKLPKTYNTRIPFTCEVSTEGPRFAFVKRTDSLTIAVIPKEDPVVTVEPETVQPGEDVLVNCSTAPAMPAALIKLFVDGRLERPEPWLGDTQISPLSAAGLQSSWQALRVRAETDKGHLEIRCEATQPIDPPYKQVANATVTIAKWPHLSMFTSGSGSKMERNGLVTAFGVAVLTIIKLK